MEASQTKNPAVTPEDLLVYENLAFSTLRPGGNDDGRDDTNSDGECIRAIARAPFLFRDENDGFFSTGRGSVLLNVEFFGDPSWPRLFLYVHGICESAETWTVQNLARICASRKWRMAVLEVEGHGLSGGRAPGLLGKTWNRCVRQVEAFCKHALEVDAAQKKAAAATSHENENTATRFVLAGCSLGGALAAYGSEALAHTKLSSSLFAGTLLLSPAVGIDPSVVPHPCIVAALTVVSKIMPAVGIEGMTPTEDPSHYNCPAWTKRNFEGPWPLGTSKMLLDVVSERVPKDVATGSLNLLLCHQRKAKKSSPNHSIMVITGDKDPVVPIGTVRDFVDGMRAKARDEQRETTNQVDDGVSIEMIEIKKGDHGLLAQSMEDPNTDKTHKKTMSATIEQIVMFLKRCEAVGTT